MCFAKRAAHDVTSAAHVPTTSYAAESLLTMLHYCFEGYYTRSGKRKEFQEELSRGGEALSIMRQKEDPHPSRKEAWKAEGVQERALFTEETHRGNQ